MTSLSAPKVIPEEAIQKTVKKPKAEQRVAKIASYVRPSEKQAFIDLLGRKSESDAIRELIIEFIELNKQNDD